MGLGYTAITAYQTTNGLLEWFHRSSKASLQASLTSAAWMDKLLWFLHGLWTVPEDHLGKSSVEMVYTALRHSLGLHLTSACFFQPGHLRQHRN